MRNLSRNGVKYWMVSKEEGKYSIDDETSKLKIETRQFTIISDQSITTLTLLLNNSVLIICTADNPSSRCLAHLIQSCAGYNISSSKQFNSLNAESKSPSFMLYPARDILSFKLSPDRDICSFISKDPNIFANRLPHKLLLDFGVIAVCLNVYISPNVTHIEISRNSKIDLTFSRTQNRSYNCA